MSLYLKRYIFIIMGSLLGFSVIFTGCSTPKPSSSKLITTFIVKNNTEKFIQKVSISEISSSGKGKHGSISPLLPGTEQIYARGDKAKRLSDTLLIRWIYNDNSMYKKSISLASILDSSITNIDTTIIIEITPNNMLKVYKKMHK